MSDFYRNQFRVDGKGAAAVAADGDGSAGAADNSGGSAAGDSKAEGGADAIDGTEPGGVAGAGSDGAGGPSEFKRPMKRPNRGSRPGGSDNIAPTPPPLLFFVNSRGSDHFPVYGRDDVPSSVLSRSIPAVSSRVWLQPHIYADNYIYGAGTYLRGKGGSAREDSKDGKARRS